MLKKPSKLQGELFKTHLSKIVNPGHPLCRLAKIINWPQFDEAFGKLYCPDQGRPAKATRLMVGLQYLKYTVNLSDEEVVARWVENPYWQYFCGGEYFEHEPPIEPSSMTKWRNRIKSEGLEKLLEVTIQAGLDTKALKRRSLNKLNADTTVQEKAVSYPTDAKLYHKLREKLVKLSKEQGIQLRQSYTRKSKRAILMQGRYAHARQMKRAKKEIRSLKTYLGRVKRDVERKIADNSELVAIFADLLEKTQRLLSQSRTSKNKLYSIHAPEVECIAKGKVHKKYEFGCKVSVVSPAKENFIVGIKAFHGNPYDGHTLADAIEQSERLAKFQAKEIYVDRGYRGHNYEGEGKVYLARSNTKRVKPSLRRWLKRRSAIEPLIGHIKNNGRMGRNYLAGVEGDHINALLCACGFNIRKLLAAFLFWLIFQWQKLVPKKEILLAA